MSRLLWISENNNQDLDKFINDSKSLLTVPPPRVLKEPNFKFIRVVIIDMYRYVSE